MNNIDDEKIKKYIQEDKIISDKADQVFDNFIEKIQTEKNVNEDSKLKSKIKSKFYVLQRTIIAISGLAITFVGSNAYAHSKGYENIFFMIKDLTTSVNVQKNDDIFIDRDIIISYQSFEVAKGIKMQINELQVEKNQVKLYALIQEESDSISTPFNYVIYNDETNKKMCKQKSSKKEKQKAYTEIFYLDNYTDSTNIIKMEIYDKNNILLKTVKIDLKDKTIEAKTENENVDKISQIKLFDFLRNKTKEMYKNNKQEILIIKTVDIYYSDAKFVVKYLYLKPTEEEIKNNKIEESTRYIGTATFTVLNNEFKLINIEETEILD